MSAPVWYAWLNAAPTRSDVRRLDSPLPGTEIEMATNGRLAQWLNEGAGLVLVARPFAEPKGDRGRLEDGDFFRALMLAMLKARRPECTVVAFVAPGSWNCLRHSAYWPAVCGAGIEWRELDRHRWQWPWRNLLLSAGHGQPMAPWREVQSVVENWAHDEALASIVKVHGQTSKGGAVDPALPDIIRGAQGLESHLYKMHARRVFESARPPAIAVAQGANAGGCHARAKALTVVVAQQSRSLGELDSQWAEILLGKKSATKGKARVVVGTPAEVEAHAKAGPSIAIVATRSPHTLRGLAGFAAKFRIWPTPRVLADLDDLRNWLLALDELLPDIPEELHEICIGAAAAVEAGGNFKPRVYREIARTLPPRPGVLSWAELWTLCPDTVLAAFEHHFISWCQTETPDERWPIFDGIDVAKVREGKKMQDLALAMSSARKMRSEFAKFSRAAAMVDGEFEAIAALAAEVSAEAEQVRTAKGAKHSVGRVNTTAEEALQNELAVWKVSGYDFEKLFEVAAPYYHIVLAENWFGDFTVDDQFKNKGPELLASLYGVAVFANRGQQVVGTTVGRALGEITSSAEFRFASHPGDRYEVCSAASLNDYLGDLTFGWHLIPKNPKRGSLGNDRLYFTVVQAGAQWSSPALRPDPFFPFTVVGYCGEHPSDYEVKLSRKSLTEQLNAIKEKGLLVRR